MKQWQVIDCKMRPESGIAIPMPGDNEVLVRFHAAAVNDRDLLICGGKYRFPYKKSGIVPLSDGAGKVLKVGRNVTRFKEGDNVVTILNQGHIAGQIDEPALYTGVGGMIDGALREYGSYSEQGLVHMPNNLSFMEAAALPCAGVTAWNALYGGARRLMPGDWVLTQGAGSVSMFAIKFAKAGGGRVISTTSSPEKARRLMEIGADHVINYKQDETWGHSAKRLTGGSGVQHVFDIGGPKTLKHTFDAIGIGAQVSVIGWIQNQAEDPVSFYKCWCNMASIRSLFVGSRAQFEEMNLAISAHNIKPVLDPEVFTLDTAREAYRYVFETKNFGKVVIRID